MHHIKIQDTIPVAVFPRFQYSVSIDIFAGSVDITIIVIVIEKVGIVVVKHPIPLSVRIEVFKILNTIAIEVDEEGSGFRRISGVVPIPIIITGKGIHHLGNECSGDGIFEVEDAIAVEIFVDVFIDILLEFSIETVDLQFVESSRT